MYRFVIKSFLGQTELKIIRKAFRYTRKNIESLTTSAFVIVNVAETLCLFYPVISDNI